MIELDKLSKTFTQKNGKEFRAVDSVSLTVEKGEICVFLGPSGCGKTTTLKMINRIIPPTSGRVLIDGQDTADLDEVTLRRHIGYVIQQIGLFPNMTIEENIMVVPRLLGWDKARCKEKARELMSMVKLEPKQYLQRYPRELSGGQQQRVGVIRALAADAPLLLMDEPFGAVDPINRESIQNEFFEMQRKLGMTVIMVSHDIDEAIKLGDKVAVFKSGRLLQYDHPDTLLAHPADEFVSAFTGQDSTLKRLLLVRAEDAADSSLVTARPQTPVAEALELMDENDRRYLIVVDDQGKGLGYVRRKDLRRQEGTCEPFVTPFRVTASHDEHLRILLSRMYEFNSSWLPVLDPDQQFLGEVTQESIADYLSSGRSRRQGPDRVAGRTGRSVGRRVDIHRRQPPTAAYSWRVAPSSARRNEKPGIRRASPCLFHSTGPPRRVRRRGLVVAPLRLDDHRAGDPRREQHAVRHFVDVYPHRHALGQAHPVESGVDVGGQLAAFRVVAVVDTAGDAFHVALEVFAAHQLHVHRVAFADVRQLGFLEVAVDPVGVLVDHRHLRLADPRVVATVHVEVGDVAVDLRHHPGALQVQARGVELGLGLLVVGHRRGGGVVGVVAAFAGDHHLIHFRAPPGVQLAHLQGRLARGDQRLGLLHRDAVVVGVDLHQQVAFLHQLVVAHRDVDDDPGNVGGDIDHVGAHATVAGPGVSM